ncbi:TPA_asm: EAL domain-containing protein [Salmonella enterica subsp. enterica serovar Dublin]|uniref:Anti-FlhC(2)FlhD(4) factor YdiV n=1 Tax=Salmonella dublin TaxID=98360 RepID=A0A732CY92_SALDU|nr:EAL domain-containing protein [Salmonella enterica subsp. enterica serovar 4,[5],12:b:-]HAC6853892.1 EAL domain-containing protein [Salmonella enterica subsp. enterica serovar Dublin]HAE4979928.1 EAL domain-containing protein [Salmonella enterica subsp. enterica serovar Dublin]
MPQDEEEDVMKNTYHIKRILFTGFVGMLLAVMLSALTTWCKLLIQTRNDLTELSENALYTVGEYMKEAQTFLDDTLRRKPLDCSLKSREIFIPELLSAVIVTDLLYTLPDNTVCSLTYGDNISSVPQKRLVTRWEDMQLYILADDVLAAGKNNLLAGKDGVFTLLPQQQMLRFYITGQAQQPRLRIMVNGVALAHSADSAAPPDSSWLIVSKTADNGLTVEFSLPFSSVREYWFYKYWPTQWAVNLLCLLLFGICFYGYIRYQLSMKTAIRRALRKREFCLHYQPVVDINTGKIHALEALIRWPSLSGRAVPPDIFIPAAEDTGLICAVTRYVLHQAVSDLSMLHQIQPDLTVAVNLSAADLADNNFATTLGELCSAYALSPGYLKLEITERSMVEDAVARRNIHSLAEQGFIFVLDDFGTGYSCLSYLNILPVRTLKIDRSFITGLHTPAAAGSVLPQIVSMARQLNMDVIAEGVESMEQARALSALQVRYVQGWLYDRAMPLAEVYKKLCISEHYPCV